MSVPTYSTNSPRRFRFGLRTLFVLVMIVAIPCAWVAYSLSWVRQRREFANSSGAKFISTVAFNVEGNLAITNAPNGLWLFGEQGTGTISLVHCPPDAKDHLVKRATRLFPEAYILFTPDTDSR